MVAKFPWKNNTRKVWATVLFLSVIYRFVICVPANFIVSFSAILVGPQFVEIQKFCYHGKITY